MSMPVLSVELQILKGKILKEKQELILEQLRTARRLVLTPNLPNTPLSKQEDDLLVTQVANMYDSILAETNKLFFGAEELRKQMRASWVWIHGRPLSQPEEGAIDTHVNGLLNDRNQDPFLENFKYESDDVSEKMAQGKGDMPEGLQNMVSKMETMFGGGPLGFIGKLLGQVLGALFSVMPFFKDIGEKMNPKKTPADLLKAGNLEEADNILKSEERALLSKMDDVEAMIGNNVPALGNVLKMYKAELAVLENQQLLQNASEEYKKSNLETRIRMYENFSKESSIIIEKLDQVKKLQSIKDELNKKWHELNNLKLGVAPASEQEKLFILRMNAINQNWQEKNNLQTKVISEGNAKINSLLNVAAPQIAKEFNSHQTVLNDEKQTLRNKGINI